LVVSLLIHVGIGLLLLVTLRRQPREEWLPPPAPVTMVFESGRRQGPTLPEPSPRASAPPAVAPVPLPPVPVAPPPEIKPAPPVVEAPPVPPLPAPVPPRVPPVIEAPLPPREKAEVEALPPKPAPRRPPPPKPSDFPAPMNFSFGKPVAPSSSKSKLASTQRSASSMDMSLGPAQKGAMNDSPFADNDEGGPDWRNALSQWVEEHAYYPEQARRDGDEGDVRVHVIAEHNGRVTLVDLTGKSGSMWLDLALQAMFRDAHLPPLPTEGSEPIEFNFTMHYILRRMN
jgi:protein TonB